MNKPRSGVAIAGKVLLGAGLMIGVIAGCLTYMLGSQFAPPVRFGTVLAAEVGEGEHAVYVTPSDQWGSIECVVRVDGEENSPRADMLLQSLYFPERWDTKGSFDVTERGTATVLCNGPLAGGEFTTGPAISFLHVVGVGLVAALAIVLIVLGLLLWLVGGRRRRIRPAEWPAERPTAPPADPHAVTPA